MGRVPFTLTPMEWLIGRDSIMSAVSIYAQEKRPYSRRLRPAGIENPFGVGMDDCYSWNRTKVQAER
jgi:hypothetical protein